MKLGGITWWRNNYGSILQAYALQSYLRENLGQDYIIINQYWNLFYPVGKYCFRRARSKKENWYY